MVSALARVTANFVSFARVTLVILCSFHPPPPPFRAPISPDLADINGLQQRQSEISEPPKNMFVRHLVSFILAVTG